MIETEAVVIQRDGERVTVESQVSGGGCGKCQTSGGCGGGRSLLGIRPGSTRIEVAADLDVQPGDRVMVGLPDSGFLRASAALYLVPLIGMFAGAGVVQWLGGQLALSAVDVLTLLGGGAGLAAGFLWQRGFGRRFAADPAHRPRLLRRLEGRACPPEAAAGT